MTHSAPLVMMKRNPDDVVRQVTDKLRLKFPDIDLEVIDAVVREEVRAFAERPVQDYVAILSARSAERRIKELGWGAGRARGET